MIPRIAPPSPALLALVALAVLAWWIVYGLTVERPDRSRLISDSARYADIGRSLARGDGYIDRLVTPAQAALSPALPRPAAAWSPLTMMLEALAFKTAGIHTVVPIAVNALGFLVALIALFALGHRLLGPTLGWIPAFFLALDPDVLALATDGLTEGWYTAFLVLTVLILIGRDARPPHPIAGVTLALAQLTRVTAIALIPALALSTRARGRAALLPLVVFVATLVPWLLYRFGVHGSLGFDIERLNLLHGMSVTGGESPYRSVMTPDALSYLVSHPLETAAKWVSGIGKSVVLLVLDFLSPLELVLTVAGVAVMIRNPAQRPVALCFLALLATQIVIGATTLLDLRLWQPVGVLLLVPLAMGAGWLGRRLWPGEPGLGLGAVVIVVSLLPFLHHCLDARLDPGLGRARWTEEEAINLGAWTAHLVPEDHGLVTEYEELVWYADRAVVWLPDDPEEMTPLRVLTGAGHALWRDSPAGDRHPTPETWRRFFDGEVARGAMRRLGELRLETGVYVIGRWEETTEEP